MPAATTRRVLHVLGAAPGAADRPLGVQRTWVVGAASSCDVVLEAEGVAARHCALATDARGHVTCTALEAPVWVGQRLLRPGATIAMPDFLPLRCGRATLFIGSEGSDWSYSVGAAARSPVPGQRSRRPQPAAFAGAVMGGLLLLAGSVWGAAHWLSSMPHLPLDDVARAERWLRGVAPPGSELQLIADEARQRWVVSGYVAGEGERAVLHGAASRLRHAPAVEVTPVEPLLAQLRTVASREGLACDAVHRGAGQVACVNALPDVAAAARLRTAAAKIDGLQALDLAVAGPPPPAAMAAAAIDPGRAFAVLISSRRGAALVGPAGQRWAEGDRFGDMTIRRIGFDEVLFERGREELLLTLAQIPAALAAR